ncbi:MAG: hypothetical protein D8M58_19255 [Calditrichaeota bacterium]|nr:MAG: hypothetical protein DWQ03_21935 [Calditrichota bacterium]MBL1207550.1 hypothetical protein [Calditrichota bacterium]NOG47382.1 PorV/PorQ family protein [Calditrichota bacterium]
MKLLCIYILAIFFLASNIYAGDPNRIGTTSGTQLLIPIGARSIALGNSTIANVSGVEALYWNPAGASKIARSEVMVNQMQYIADINVSFIGGILSTNEIGTFGFFVNSLDFGDITETTTDLPEGTGRTYSPTFVTAGVTYSRYLTDRILAGVTGKYISEEIQQTSASALAFDFGIQYAFNNELRLGVVLKNLGGKMQYDGRNLETESQIPGSNVGADNGFFRGIAVESNIPTIFTMGLAYKVNINESNNVNFMGSFSNFNEANDEIYAGAEYALNNTVFLRGGYHALTEQNDDNLFGATFGAGLNYEIDEFVVTIDYAFSQVTDYFDSNNVFTIKFAY